MLAVYIRLAEQQTYFLSTLLLVAFFRSERSDDRKYVVCGSQANKRPSGSCFIFRRFHISDLVFSEASLNFTPLCGLYINYIFGIPVPAGAFVLYGAVFCQYFLCQFPTGGDGREGGRAGGGGGGGEEKLIHGKLPFKHTSLLKTKDLISSDPDSFRFALEKIAAHRRNVPL